ncbi:DUF6272 family protein [Kamptonema sp. UHCC 0994]|uniref:DUF6272 family protein n=1 Tax=Kamptonema sp. UHCC 0994 TaxID=3031329 RepID=UPI0023B88F2D|nr:DUF6272 family protein [Kamptonema sp. UHCC 0994]MDF0553809.1 DUF6272 family protein [Kamptonema sp. UHCC 0994]
MSQVFGEFINDFPLHDYLELSFTHSFNPSEKMWCNCRLSAYFLADYFSNLLPIDEDEDRGEERIKAMKNAVSYIGNELLENAMKFNEFSKHKRVNFGIHFLEDLERVTAIIFTKNSINSKKIEKFQAFIEELLSADLNELYVQQIEKAAASEQSEASGLGLLTIINDYSAKLGWKFESEPSAPQIIIVTTMAQIVV